MWEQRLSDNGRRLDEILAGIDSKIEDKTEQLDT